MGWGEDRRQVAVFPLVQSPISGKNLSLLPLGKPYLYWFK
jgi:hypothetical protein